MFDFMQTHALMLLLPLVCACAVLTCACAALLAGRYRLRRSLGEIVSALINRRRVPGVFFGPKNRVRDELASEINELVAENRELQRRSSGQLAQLEATLGSLQEAVLIIDQDNLILLANRALQSIFPGAATALHQRFERVIHGVAFLEYVEAVRVRTARPQHEIAFAAGAETRWVEITGTGIPAGGAGGDDGAGGGAGSAGSASSAGGGSVGSDGSAGGGASWSLFVFHDITRRKKLEAVRKEFVANVSHELRTPLSVIKGYAETLMDGHRDMPVADRDRFLRTIHRHSERLATLIEDLLSLSRLESGDPGLRIERVSLPKIMHAVADDYRARPAAAGHAIVVTVGAGVGVLDIDANKCTQVFENLLGNALKYTPAGSRVDITARVCDGGDGREGGVGRDGGSGREVEVCVRDDGPGIPEADLPHIFERFYRVDKGRSRDTGGTGLGLSIVKHIVQLHGGRVRVESGAGRGAAFYFTLPAPWPSDAPRV
jgi:two-component system phosphate regulon sensor histidine kinase PhoR